MAGNRKTVNPSKIHVISWRWKTKQKKKKGNRQYTLNNYDNPYSIYAQYSGVWYIKIDMEITLELEVE